MGFYIETGERLHKGRFLVNNHAAKPITSDEARIMQADHDIVVVVNNGLFEAACFAFDRSELESCLQPGDTRPKQCYALPKGVGARLSGYAEAQERRHE